MKRISKVLLVLAAAVFLAASCSNAVNDSGSDNNKSPHQSGGENGGGGETVTRITGDGEHFPLIKITSLNGSSDFATKPVAAHVNPNGTPPWEEACDIYFGDELIGQSTVKVRGNWTTSYAKKSLRIKFNKKQNMLGLHDGKKYKKWVLLADFKDASLLRNAVAFEMYRKMFPKNYASDCQLVELVINDESFGVYLLAEQQEAKRLGLTEPTDDNDTKTEIGYLLEFDNYYTNEADNEKFTINHEQFGKLKNYAKNEVKIYNPGYTIKSDVNENDTAQHDFIANYMNKLWEICYKAVYKNEYYKFNAENSAIEAYTPAGSSDDKKCENCIKEIIDINSLADCYIFSELTCDPDLYYSSFYLNVDFGEGKDKKLRFDAPWDFDSTMGNKSFCISDTSHEDYSKQYVSSINDMHAGKGQANVNCQVANNFANPWMVIFINQTWFRDLVKERWRKINRTEVLSYVNNYIDANSADGYQQVYDDMREKWGNPSGNIELCAASKTAAATSQKASAEYFKTWLNARFTALDTIINGL